MRWRIVVPVVIVVAGASSAAVFSRNAHGAPQLPKIVQRPRVEPPPQATQGRVDGANPDKPDAVVEEVAIRKDSLTEIRRALEPGELVTLSCDLFNQGLTPPDVWWSAGHYVDGVRVQSQQMRGLGNHSRIGVKYAAPATEGIHYYECRLDEDNVLAEVDERNNRREMAFRVERTTGAGSAPVPPPGGNMQPQATPPATPGARRPAPGPATPLPDLIVRDVALDGCRIVVWVQNVGAADVNGVDVQLYWDDNPWYEPVFRGGTRLAIRPGEFLTFTNYYWEVLPRGTSRVRAVVDSMKKVHESNETNNELTVTFIRR